MMACMHAIVRSRCGVRPAGLAAMLAVVNRLFCDCTAANDFATLFFSEYDDETRVLRYVNCGHLPPLLFRRKGGVTRLEATATVLGIFDNWQGREAEVRLEVGDLLVFYTDGLTEASAPQTGEFGEDGLVRAVRREAGCDPRALCRILLDEVRAHGGGVLHDDFTLVAARCVARGGDSRGRGSAPGVLPC